MGGRNYTEIFVRYIEIAEKVHRYKRAIFGMSPAALEDVCGRMFGYSEKDLKDEERRIRIELLESIKETFHDRKPSRIWADGCLFKERDFLEMNFITLLCDASSFAVLRCQSYKRNLKKNGGARITPRELEQEFHKECMAMAEMNERKKKGKTQPVKVKPLRMAGATS